MWFIIVLKSERNKKMAKLWGGRFRKSTDKKVDDFNSSIRFDKRLDRARYNAWKAGDYS